MNLSVIIPTFNRADLLKKALQSISVQTFSQNCFEVIVVDNGSEDDTVKIVGEFEHKIKNLRYFYDSTPGLHTGRHIGLKESKNEILVYTDDDIVAFPTWLQAINESFTDETVALVGGNNFPEYETTPPLWVESLWSYNQFGKHNGQYSLIDFGNERKEIDPYFVYGCNFSIRKKILLEVKGFHPDAMPIGLIKYRGDGESYVSGMISHKKYKTIFNPEASVFHFVSKHRMTEDYLYNRGFIQGISNSFSDIRTKRNENIQPQAKKQLIKRVVDRILARDIKQQLFLIRDELVSVKNQKQNPDNKYKQAFTRGLSDGYSFHQNEVTIDGELKKWVLKDNFLHQ